MSKQTPVAKINPVKVPAEQAKPGAVVDSNVTSRTTIPSIEPPRERKSGHHRDSSVENPRTIIRQALLVIFLFFGVLGTWSVFGHISGAVVGSGKVKVESERKTVQHLEGGIVDSILVREGDFVKEGQPLVIMESTQVDASVDLYRKQLAAQLALQARLVAEKDMADDIVWPEELSTLIADNNGKEFQDSEEKIFTSRREALLGQLSLLEMQIKQIGSQIKGFQEQINSEDAIIATLHEELKSKRELFRERFLEKSQILELERQLATHQGNRGRLRQSIAETEQRKAELELRIADSKNRFVEEATSLLGRADNEILQLRDRIRPLADAKRRLTVVAPVTGLVVGLNVHSKGGVVRAGDPLMDIVPEDTALIVEMQVPINKITQVHIGQEAQGQLDAFDIRKTPLIKGKVSYISADRHEERTNYGVNPYYVCYVEMDKQALKDAGVFLSPGMPVTVFITTHSRSVLDYMIEPLLKNWELALRE